jgi:hypothetical protein
MQKTPESFGVLFSQFHLLQMCEKRMNNGRCVFLTSKTRVLKYARLLTKYRCHVGLPFGDAGARKTRRPIKSAMSAYLHIVIFLSGYWRIPSCKSFTVKYCWLVRIGCARLSMRFHRKTLQKYCFIVRFLVCLLLCIAYRRVANWSSAFIYCVKWRRS